MFGRPVRSNLGIRKFSVVDHGLNERKANEMRKAMRENWNKKYNYLSELSEDRWVWAKAPTGVGTEAVLQYVDENPQSY